jgi:hypothetical protein
MPQRVEKGSGTAAYAALRAGLDRCLKQFEEWNAASMLGFATTDLAAHGTDTARVDADAGTQGDVFDDGVGGGVDRVEAVAALDQYARAELPRWRAYTGHDGCGQGDFEQRNSIVEPYDIVQAGFFRVIGE